MKKDISRVNDQIQASGDVKEVTLDDQEHLGIFVHLFRHHVFVSKEKTMFLKTKNKKSLWTFGALDGVFEKG